MPAIQLARLRLQTATFADNYQNIEIFIRDLHELLAFYSDRVHRSGRAGIPAPLKQSYNIPKPVLRQVLAVLVEPAAQDPGNILKLCNALWMESYLEFKQLAVRLLGLVELDDPTPVLNIAISWTTQENDSTVIRQICQDGLENIRRNYSNQYLLKARELVESKDLPSQKVGLMLLIELAGESAFENAPALFRIIGPYVYNTPYSLKPELVEIFSTLAQRLPLETAHFLRQMLDTGGKPGSAWIIRQILQLVSPDTQKLLREALRGSE